jgi:Tol biopolymer transport system component
MPGSVDRPDGVEIGCAVQRLEGSTAFERSASLLKLLRFLIEEAARHPEAMKETYVGAVFYNREATYDPRFDSIVRVNVMRLRQRLTGYYAGEGNNDPLKIEIPRGSYVPFFIRREPAPAPITSEGTPDTVAEAPAKPAGWQFAGGKVALLLVLVCILVCIPVLLHSLRRAKKPVEPPFVSQTLQVVPLTMGLDLEFEPAASPDGKVLAYVSRAPGSTQFQIFLRSFHPDGKGERILETGAGNALYPAWSPNGKQIAFLRCGRGPCEIAIVPAAGGEVEAVQTLPTYDLPDDQPYYQYRQLNPIWTADGQGLIFPYRELRDNSERLVLLDLKTKRRRQLTWGAVGDEDAAPALSPDGKSVGFLRRHLSHAETMVLDLRTLRTRVLETEPNDAQSGLTWSPDGSGLVVGINRRKGFRLLWVPLQGGAKELDVRAPIVLNPVFARKHKGLMVLFADRTRNLAEVAGDTGDPKPVFPSRLRNTETAFSPDARQLAFLSDRSGTFEVWMAQRSGESFSQPRQLTHGLSWYPSSIVWSPDGHTLAVGISNTNEIDMVDAQSGAISRLRLPGLEDSVIWSPEWSADGRWIYVAAWGEKNGIFRVSTTPVPSVQQILEGRVRELRIDGNRAVYYEPNYGRGIYRVSLTGDPRPQPVAQLQDILPSRAWFIEAGKLYYFDVDDRERRLHCFDLATGAQTDVTGPVPRIAFADGTLSYDSRDRLLIYSEWGEAAGAQIMLLRWK